MVSAGWWPGAPPQQRQNLIAGRVLTMPDGSRWLFGAWGRWYRWTPADGQWHLCPPPMLSITRGSALPLRQGMPVPPVPPHVVPTGPDLAYDPPSPLAFVDAGIRPEVTSRVRSTVESAAALPTPDYPHWWGLFSPSAPSTVPVTWGVMLWCATAPVFDSRLDAQLLGLWSAYRTRPFPDIDGPRWLTPPPLESLIALYAGRLRAGRVDAAVVILRTMWAIASALREDVRFQPRADALIAMLGVTLQNPTVDYGALAYGDQAVVQQWLTRCPPALAPALRVEASAGEHFRNAYYDLATALTPVAGDPSSRGYVEPRLIAAALLAADLAVVRQDVSNQVIAWLDPQVSEVMRAMLIQRDHPLRPLWPEGDRLPRSLRERTDAADPSVRSTLLATMYGADLAWCRLGGGIPARPRGFPSSVAILAEIIGPRRATSAAASEPVAQPPGIAPLAHQYPANPGGPGHTPGPSMAHRPPTGPPGQAPSWAPPPPANVPPATEAWDGAQPPPGQNPGEPGPPAPPPTEAWIGSGPGPSAPPPTEPWSGATGASGSGVPAPPPTEAWTGTPGSAGSGAMPPPPATEAWAGATGQPESGGGTPSAPPATQAWPGTGEQEIAPPPATPAWPGANEPPGADAVSAAPTTGPGGAPGTGAGGAAGTGAGGAPATQIWPGDEAANTGGPPPATQAWPGTGEHEAGPSSAGVVSSAPATQAWPGTGEHEAGPPSPGAASSAPATRVWSASEADDTGRTGTAPPATRAWQGGEGHETDPSRPTAATGEDEQAEPSSPATPIGPEEESREPAGTASPQAGERPPGDRDGGEPNSVSAFQEVGVPDGDDTASHPAEPEGGEPDSVSALQELSLPESDAAASRPPEGGQKPVAALREVGGLESGDAAARLPEEGESDPASVRREVGSPEGGGSASRPSEGGRKSVAALREVGAPESGGVDSRPAGDGESDSVSMLREVGELEGGGGAARLLEEGESDSASVRREIGVPEGGGSASRSAEEGEPGSVSALQEVSPPDGDDAVSHAPEAHPGSGADEPEVDGSVTHPWTEAERLEALGLAPDGSPLPEDAESAEDDGRTVAGRGDGSGDVPHDPPPVAEHADDHDDQADDQAGIDETERDPSGEHDATASGHVGTASGHAGTAPSHDATAPDHAGTAPDHPVPDDDGTALDHPAAGEDATLLDAADDVVNNATMLDPLDSSADQVKNATYVDWIGGTRADAGPIPLVAPSPVTPGPPRVPMAGEREPARPPGQGEKNEHSGTRVMSNTMIGGMIGGAPMPDQPVEQIAPPAPAPMPKVAERFGIRFLSGIDDATELLDDLRRKASASPPVPPPALLIVGDPHTGQRRLTRLIARTLAGAGVGDGSVRTADGAELRGDHVTTVTAILRGGGPPLLFERLDRAILDATDPARVVAAVAGARARPSVLIATATPDNYTRLAGRYPELARAFQVFRLPDLSGAGARLALLHVLADERRVTINASGLDVVRGDLGRLAGHGDLVGARLVEAYLDRAVSRHTEREGAPRDRLVLQPVDFAGVAEDIEPVLRPPRDVDGFLRGLSEMIGLEEVKRTVGGLVAEARLAADRATRGLPSGNPSRHLIFLGRPGTGKATVAGLIGGIYAALNLIDSGHLVVCTARDFAGGDIGAKVATHVDRAMGGVLLIEDAYLLDRMSVAVDELSRLMEERRDKFMVICASLPDEMEGFLLANPGFRAEFGAIVDFREPTERQLVQLFSRLAERDLYMLDEELRVELLDRFAGMRRFPEFAFADTVRRLFDQIVARQASRLAGARVNPAAVARLTIQDLPVSEGARLLQELHPNRPRRSPE